jgi:hypothetical protein
MADAAVGMEVSFPPLDHAQTKALRDALGSHVALANPLDYHTFVWGDRAAIARTFTAMMQGDLSMGVVVADFPRPDRCDASAWDLVIDAVSDTMVATGRPMAILATLPETMPEDVAQTLVAQGIVPLCGVDDGLRAIEAAAWLGQERAVPAPVVAVGDEPQGPVLWSEAEAKACLSRFGVQVPQGEMASGPHAAADAAARLGFPVVLKTVGVAHKSERGGVVLNLGDVASVQVAAAAMGAQEFLVEEMVSGAGVELLVGVFRDPGSGFVLTLGAGGVLTEVMQDSVSLLVPASRAEVDAALSRLRMAPLLDGYRGAPPVDRNALLEAIDAVQDCVVAHAERLLELEINPLIATADRAVAVDALIRWETGHERNTDPQRAARQRAGGHAGPAQGQRHRPGDQPHHGRGLHRVPRRSRPARGHRHRRGREVLLPRLGPEGRRRWRRGRRRLRRRAASADCRSCAG